MENPSSPFQDRYSRQQLFTPIGPDGQARLATKRVAIVGLGALGTVLSTQLVRAGIGFIRLIDRDIIEPSNLQRQTLYDERDALEKLPKALASATKLCAVNSEVTIEAKIADLTSRNSQELLGDVDLIVDGSDNFQVRYLINDFAVQKGIPWSYGGAVSSYGTTAFFEPNQTSCLVCLFGDEGEGGHDTCDTIGVIAPIVSIIASLQVTEALKYLTGNDQALSRQLTTIDVWKNTYRAIALGAPKKGCRCCAHRQFPSLQRRTEALTVSFCGRKTIQVKADKRPSWDLQALAQKLLPFGNVLVNEHLLRLDLGEEQITVFQDGRALFHGVDDHVRARTLYARYLGM